MKRQNYTLLLVMLISMIGEKVFAHDLEVMNDDGVTIYYVWTNNKTELAVSYRGDYENPYDAEYAGDIVIPASVTYDGKTYGVTSIGDYAFYGCRGLTSITIPNRVSTIGYCAFHSCTGLTSITIPNSVTSVGGSAFYHCI